MGIIQEHNRLVTMINRAKSYNDILEVQSALKDFEREYSQNDAEVEKLNSMFMAKLSNAIAENEAKSGKIINKVNEIKKSAYDFSDEQDYTQAVHTKTMQLVAELPTNPSGGNKAVSVQKLVNAIESGLVGSRAVLELMNRPLLSELFSEDIKRRALEGSKSAEQRLVEHAQAIQLERVGKEQAELYNKGFKLRHLQTNIQKKASAEASPYFTGISTETSDSL